MKYKRYVIVTPVKNEERYIEKTIHSMLEQTILPVLWVIVSDASTDNTDRIVKYYEDRTKWIKFVRRSEEKHRDFASKVYCFNEGLKYLEKLDYDFIGNIDGDISFDERHFEFLIERFSEDPNLGLAGSLMLEKGYDTLRDSVFDDRDVFGAVQFFRKNCFEDTGGYVPVNGGGVDWLAVRMARMKGWKTKTFIERSFYHHHPMGTGSSGKIFARFDYGRKDYAFGNHPIWELLRVVFQMKSKPYVIGGLLIGLGYLSAILSIRTSNIPKEVRKFNRKEQLARLRKMIFRRFVNDRGL